MSDDINIQTIDNLDRGLSYAESCFETFRVVDGVIFIWHKHWQRLQLGLQSFGIDLHDKHQQYIKKQCLDAAARVADDCLVRLSVSGGKAAWGLHQSAVPNVYIQSTAFTKNTQPIHLQSMNYPFALSPKPAKFTSDYAMMLRALQSWKLNAPHTPLVCKDEIMISATTANIAFFINNAWLTPQGDGVLMGTIRQFLIENASLSMATCPINMLKETEAAVLFNAGSFIQVVHSINDTALAPHHPAIQSLKQILYHQRGVI